MDVDTIAAVATPRGGALAVVRVSGPDAGAVLARISENGRTPPPRAPTLLRLVDPDDGSPIDRALVTRFVGPASYTGEDLVELSCHGGWLVPDLVMDACTRAGARPAEPGEFTKRAYLHGKMDLVQAEAVGDLVGARSRAMQRAAMDQLDRGLSNRLAGLRGELLRMEALLAHHIDFPEEDEAPVPVHGIVAAADGLVSSFEAMLATAPEGELLREGALVVLAGRPNAGKSSLFNALIGEQRAIVTAEPGTTRDALEVTVQLDGFPFRLVDTAGLRDAEGEVERLGIEVARRYVDRADAVVLCAPRDEGLTEADRAFVAGRNGTPVVLVGTKADLGPGDADAEVDGADGFVWASAVSGAGLDEVRSALRAVAFAGLGEADDGVPVITRRRHARALEVARSEIAAFARGLTSGLPAEVASTHLRTAESALEEVLGVVSVDDVLDVVFRDFCVGK